MINLRNEKGITFIVLATTIIVIFVIAGVSINLGLEGVDNSDDKQDLSMLYMVQEAVLGQYAMAQSLDIAEKEVGTVDVSKLYYGQKIVSINDINIDANKFSEAGLTSPFPSNDVYVASLADGVQNEDYYYRIKTADLKNLKLIRPGDSEEKVTTEETVDTFIVNYRTGEVFNETKQITKTNKKLLYIKGKTIEKTKTIDNTSFVD